MEPSLQARFNLIGSVKKNIEIKESFKKRNIFSVIQGKQFFLICKMNFDLLSPQINYLPFKVAIYFFCWLFNLIVLAAVKKSNKSSTDESIKRAIGEALKHVPKKVRAAERRELPLHHHPDKVKENTNNYSNNSHDSSDSSEESDKDW